MGEAVAQIRRKHEKKIRCEQRTIRESGPERRGSACALFCLQQSSVIAPLIFAQDVAQESNTPNLPRMQADPTEALLESGFRHLYELDFQAARSNFTDYQKAAPNDPMGKSAEAASYLYEQFNAKGVLSSEFFLNDDTFLGGVNGKPSQNENPLFLKTNQQAREMAKQQLKSNPHDTRALLAITIADGMESDYDAIIQKKQFPALGHDATGGKRGGHAAGGRSRCEGRGCGAGHEQLHHRVNARI